MGKVEEGEEVLNYGTVEELKQFLRSQGTVFTTNKKLKKAQYQEKVRALLLSWAQEKQTAPRNKKGSRKGTPTASTIPAPEVKQSIPENPYLYSDAELKQWLSMNGVAIWPDSKYARDELITLVFKARDMKQSPRNTASKQKANFWPAHVDNPELATKQQLIEWLRTRGVPMSPYQELKGYYVNLVAEQNKLYEMTKFETTQEQPTSGTLFPDETWSKQKIMSWLTEHNVTLPTDSRFKEYYLDLVDEYQDKHRYRISFIGFGEDEKQNMIQRLAKQDEADFTVVTVWPPKDLDFLIPDPKVGHSLYWQGFLAAHGKIISWANFSAALNI
jgi:hypothetical protein